jgi:hypothetical protein
MIHTINKAKVESELNKRGWKRGQYGEWLMPVSCSPRKVEEDWTAAILIGIVCEFEEKKKDNEEFLRKHPTDSRHM